MSRSSCEGNLPTNRRRVSLTLGATPDQVFCEGRRLDVRLSLLARSTLGIFDRIGSVTCGTPFASIASGTGRELRATGDL